MALMPQAAMPSTTVALAGPAKTECILTQAYSLPIMAMPFSTTGVPVRLGWPSLVFYLLQKKDFLCIA